MAKNQTYAELMEQANALIAKAKQQQKEDTYKLGEFVKKLIETDKLEKDAVLQKYIALFGETFTKTT